MSSHLDRKRASKKNLKRKRRVPTKSQGQKGENGNRKNSTDEEEDENASGFTKQSRDIIRKLLTIDSSKRLGSNNGFVEIKSHSWFSSVNWDLARVRKWRNPSIIPNCPKYEKEMYAMLQKTAEEEGFDQESSARHAANFTFEFSAEVEKAFQAVESITVEQTTKSTKNVTTVVKKWSPWKHELRSTYSSVHREPKYLFIVPNSRNLREK